MSSLALILISDIYALLLIPSQHGLTIFLKYDAVKCNVLNDYTYPTLNQATHRNVGYEEMMGLYGLENLFSNTLLGNSGWIEVGLPFRTLIYSISQSGGRLQRVPRDIPTAHWFYWVLCNGFFSPVVTLKVYVALVNRFLPKLQLITTMRHPVINFSLENPSNKKGLPKYMTPLINECSAPNYLHLKYKWV